MTHWLYLMVGEYGLVIVFLNVFVDQIGLPVPAVPTLVLAGALAANGALPPVPLFGCAVTACLAADCGWYVIGKRYGIRVLKVLCRISLEPDSCVSETQTRFERWGINSLVVAKFIPGLSIIAPPMAGALRIGWPRFLSLSIASAMLWVGSALVVGMLVRHQIEAFLIHVDDFGGLAAGTVGAALVVYVAYKWLQRFRFLKSLRMARIDVGELYDLMQAGAQPLIVDVRTSTARLLEPQGIPGSLHVPLENIAQHLNSLPRDREIILYCACPSEASAARVARVLYGGLDAWVAAGYAVVAVTAPPAVTGSVAS